MAIDRGGTTREGLWLTAEARRGKDYGNRRNDDARRRHDEGRTMVDRGGTTREGLAIGGTTTLARTCYNNNNSNSRFINRTAEDQ